MWLFHDHVVVLICHLSLGLMFAISANAKLRSLDEFVDVIYNYRLLPDFATRFVAYSVTLIESGIAVGILFRATRLYSAIAAVVLLTIVSLAMGVNLVRGRHDVGCGCFGPWLKQTISWWLVTRNGLLILMSFACILPALPNRSSNWLDWVTASSAAIVIVLLYLAASSLLSLPRSGERRHALQ